MTTETVLHNRARYLTCRKLALPNNNAFMSNHGIDQKIVKSFNQVQLLPGFKLRSSIQNYRRNTRAYYDTETVAGHFVLDMQQVPAHGHIAPRSCEVTITCKSRKL